MTVKELKEFLSSEGMKNNYYGDDQVEVKTVSALSSPEDNSITWVKNEERLTEEIIESIRKTKNLILVTPVRVEGINCVITDYPKGVFFSITNHFFATGFRHEISDKAVVLTENIGKNVHIGANCYIGEDTVIGENTIIHPNVSIICPCRIGTSCEIFSGVVIGADGFGYYKKDGVPHREVHFKGVVIGNNVDIGANTCIDRGLLTDTVIKDNAKIDNLCHIGHNDIIEENCMIIAGAVIGGSAHIKQGAYLAPGATVINQSTIGEDSTVEMGAVSFRDVKPGVVVMGNPARTIGKKGD